MGSALCSHCSTDDISLYKAREKLRSYFYSTTSAFEDGILGCMIPSELKVMPTVPEAFLDDWLATNSYCCRSFDFTKTLKDFYETDPTPAQIESVILESIRGEFRSKETYSILEKVASDRQLAHFPAFNQIPFLFYPLASYYFGLESNQTFKDHVHPALFPGGLAGVAIASNSDANEYYFAGLVSDHYGWDDEADSRYANVILPLMRKLKSFLPFYKKMAREAGLEPVVLDESLLIRFNEAPTRNHAVYKFIIYRPINDELPL